MTDKLQEAIAEATEYLLNLSNEEFKAELDKSKDSDLNKTLFYAMTGKNSTNEDPKTLTKAWEEAGRPRPPFEYLWYGTGTEQWVPITQVTISETATFFVDRLGGSDGNHLTVKALRLVTNE